MELYIEKLFLEDFYIDYGNDAINEIVKKMFIEYGNRKVFMDFKAQDFEKLEDENEYFALISNILPAIPVDSIKDHLFIKSDFNQTIVFMYEEQEWFEDAEKKGALCFSFKNYKNKLKRLLDITKIQIDLNEGFPGWDNLKELREIPSTKTIIKDHYILSNNDGQKIENNIISLLNTILPEKSDKINIETFSKEFPLLKKFEDKPTKIKEEVKKLYIQIKEALKQNNVNHKIYSLHYENDYRYHDRFILSNFYIIECSNGFNLMPSKEGDSKLECHSIFDKFYYKRLNNLKNRLSDYKTKLNSVESGFKYFPEHF